MANQPGWGKNGVSKDLIALTTYPIISILGYNNIDRHLGDDSPYAFLLSSSDPMLPVCMLLQESPL